MSVQIKNCSTDPCDVLVSAGNEFTVAPTKSMMFDLGDGIDVPGPVNVQIENHAQKAILMVVGDPGEDHTTHIIEAGATVSVNGTHDVKLMDELDVVKAVGKIKGKPARKPARRAAR